MHAKNSRPAILCFAGLDPSGGAGLQADIESIAQCGGHALPIATCLTVQDSTQSYTFTVVDNALIAQQARTIIRDIPVAACKIGVIPNVDTARCIAEVLQPLAAVPIVYDPVIAASHGSTFSNLETIGAIKSHLLPQVTVMTPNTNELGILLGKPVTDLAEASTLCHHGPAYLLVTDADEGNHQVCHQLISEDGVLHEDCYPRLSGQFHGSGCTLSSALTAYLAQGYDICESVKRAQQYTYQALQHADSPGRGQKFPYRIFH